MQRRGLLSPLNERVYLLSYRGCLTTYVCTFAEIRRNEIELRFIINRVYKEQFILLVGMGALLNKVKPC